MLTQMRTLTRGWIAYVLLFLLVIAFAIWGINDVFSGVGSQNLAEVAGRKIRPAELSRELEIELRNMRNNGQNVTTQEAVDAGLHSQLLERMILRNALYAYADKLGVSVGDTRVANYIRGIPSVQNPVTGGFDETAYDTLLQQLRFSRPEFEETIRRDMTTEMLMQSLMSGVRAPSSFGAMAVAYEGETRTVSIAEAPASVVGAIPAPTEAQVQTFYEESQEQLRLPEFRALTLVIARAQDFVARVDVPESRLREEFDARSAALTQPERRTYVRIAAPNEAQANEAAARIGRGETPQAVAQALGLQFARGENQARGEVTDAPVADAVFSLTARAAPRVVRGQLSPFVVVQVEGVTLATTPDFAAVRDELRAAIANDEASELLNTAIGAFEDARAGGASAAEAARQANLQVVNIPAVEAGGRDTNGQPVAALAEQQELLTTAFATPEGEATDFIPMGDADVVVSVDSITPSTVRPLADVREELVQVWLSRERGRRLRELGEELVTAVRGGESLAAAARARRFNIVVSSQAIDRRTAANIPARGLPGQIFAGQEGAVVSDTRADGGAVLVAVVEGIHRVDLAANPQAVEASRAQLQQSLMQSFSEALQQEIVTRAEPRRNDRLLNQAFRGSNADDGGDTPAQ